MNRGQWAGSLAMAAGHQKIAWTEDNGIALVAWQLAEGSRARWNPLDCTLPLPGAGPYNTFDGDLHVWNYKSLSDGLFATLHTLFQPDYVEIMAALAAGNDPQAVTAAVTRSPWGTEAYSRITAQVQLYPWLYLNEPLPNAWCGT